MFPLVPPARMRRGGSCKKPRGHFAEAVAILVEFEDQHIEQMEDCITKRLGFSPASKSLRIEAKCDELRKHGACANRKDG